MQHSTEPGGHFWFPARHHSTPHPHSIAHWTVLHDVQHFTIREQTRYVVQVRADPISSPSVGAIAAQYALVLNGHVAHRSFPSCSPEYTFGFVKSLVSLIALPFVPLLLAVTSTLVPPPQLALFATLPDLSAVEPHPQWPWPCLFTTIPVSTRFTSRTLQ